MYEEKNYRCETEGEVNDPLLSFNFTYMTGGRTTRVENGSFFTRDYPAVFYCLRGHYGSSF